MLLENGLCIYFLTLLCLLLLPFNCSLVQAGHLLQIQVTAALLDMLFWLLNQEGSEAGQLCSDLPGQKLLP